MSFPKSRPLKIKKVCATEVTHTEKCKLRLLPHNISANTEVCEIKVCIFTEIKIHTSCVGKILKCYVVLALYQLFIKIATSKKKPPMAVFFLLYIYFSGGRWRAIRTHSSSAFKSLNFCAKPSAHKSIISFPIAALQPTGAKPLYIFG